MTGGYIKLYRSIESWEWYTDSNTKSLFLHCLVRSNHKANKWRGLLIDPGSFITSVGTLSDETGLTIQQVRTSLHRLEQTGEILRKSTNRFTQIFVVKWADYQGVDEDDNKQITNKQQTDNKQITTNKNEKKEKNEKNTNKEGDVTITPLDEKLIFGEFDNVKLTADEMDKIKSAGLTEYIQTLSAYKKSTGKKYQSDYATILNWSRKDGKGKRSEPIPEYGQSETTVDVEELKKKLRSLK